MNEEELRDRVMGCIIGCAVGDALGTRVEFMAPEYVKNNPVTDMLGGGKYSLEPGQFTDDTSMALCVLESILEKKKIDNADILEKWWDWFQNGHFSPNQVCFDIGNTTLRFIQYCRRNNTSESRKMVTDMCGNGSLMRLAPVIMYNIFKSPVECIEASGNHSKITHYAVDGIDACRYTAALIHTIFQRPEIKKEELLMSPDSWKGLSFTSENISKIVEEFGKEKTKDDVCGKGAANFTFEAVLWAFKNFDSFSDCVLNVINLGDDADTTGAILGYLCGAYYGLKGIPTKWVEKIYFLPLITLMVDELLRLVLAEKEGEGGNFELSEKYKYVYNQFIFLEKKMNPIKRRLEPGPKFFKSLEAFDKEVERVKEVFDEEFKEANEDDIWKYFELIFKKDREGLGIKLGRSGPPLPPPPPNLDNLNISAGPPPTSGSDTSGSRGALMDEISKGGFQLKKVERIQEN